MILFPMVQQSSSPVLVMANVSDQGCLDIRVARRGYLGSDVSERQQLRCQIYPVRLHCGKEDEHSIGLEWAS
jgi:hypothetical protein